MKIKLNLIVAVTLILFITACNNNPCPDLEAHEKETIDHEQLTREVDDLFELTKTLMAEKDIEGLVNRFTANGQLKLPVSPLVQGHDALRENYRANTELEDFKLDIRTLHIEISEGGDMASVVGEFSVSFNTPEGAYQDYGISLLTLVRKDNSWKIAAEVLSSMPQVQ